MKTERPLPDYKSASLMGPTGVARTTMPTRHACDPKAGFKYVSWESTNIRATFARGKKGPE